MLKDDGRRWVELVSGLFCLAVPLAVSLPCFGQQELWQASVLPTYTSGNFGTATTTTSMYSPVLIRRLFAYGDVALVIPYVSVTSNGSVTLVGGVPNRTSRTGLTGSGIGTDRDKRPGERRVSFVDVDLSDDGLAARRIVERRAGLWVDGRGRYRF